MHPIFEAQQKPTLIHLAALGFAGLHSLSPAKLAAAEKAACLYLPQAAAYRFPPHQSPAATAQGELPRRGKRRRPGSSPQGEAVIVLSLHCSKYQNNRAEVLPSLEGIQGKPSQWFLLGGSRVGIQKGRGKRNPRPFCDSLHTFCSHRKYAHGVTGSWILRNVTSKLTSFSSIRQI